ncbi:hypothetical protein FS842_008167 [Serendipita sp. 407]|nr:hypothetical protein FS842_008167 [Serendipita sp. 407]
MTVKNGSEAFSPPSMAIRAARALNPAENHQFIGVIIGMEDIVPTGPSANSPLGWMETSNQALPSEYSK